MNGRKAVSMFKFSVLALLAFTATGCIQTQYLPRPASGVHKFFVSTGTVTSAELPSDYAEIFPDKRVSDITERRATSTWGFRDLSPKVTKLGSLRKNPAPEMYGIAHTVDQRANYVARAKNLTRRQVADDWDLIWLLRRPVRLSFYPIP